MSKQRVDSKRLAKLVDKAIRLEWPDKEIEKHLKGASGKERAIAFTEIKVARYWCGERRSSR